MTADDRAEATRLTAQNEALCKDIEREEEIKKEALRTRRVWVVGGKKEAEIMRRICTPTACHAREKA